MKFIEQIDGVPRIPWYRAAALLIPIGVVVVGSTFAMLLLNYGGSHLNRNSARHNQECQ